jgi:enoyl-CoA hydratase/carnithine racemase
MAITKYVASPQFEDYQAQFKEHFEMERKDGIILLRMHTQGGQVQWSWELHRAIGQIFRLIGSDPQNEVMILTSKGNKWINQMDTSSFEGEEDNPGFCSYEYMYADGHKMINSLIHEIEIPTIGVIPGTGFHLELPLMCDLTLCSDTTMFGDGHYNAGFIPGDGIHCALIELLGVKRAAWMLLMNERIDADKALDLGLINEVVTGDKLMDRAWQVAQHLMSQKRITRRLSVQVLRRPWKHQINDNLDVGWSSEMWAFLADRPSHRQAAASVGNMATSSEHTSAAHSKAPGSGVSQ